MTKNNTMTMEHEIQTLREATEGMILAFSLAWNNGPDIGVRKSGELGNHDPRCDSLIIGDNVWLIAGDILDAKSYDRFRRVSRVFNADPAELIVRVRSQAMVCGSMVQIDLGTHKVKEIHKINDECGQLVLV